MRYFANRYVVFIALIGLISVFSACGADESPTETSRSADPTSSEQAAVIVGNVDNGKRLFTREGCSACHRTSGDRLVGPGLAGIGSRGDDDYIRKSIREPGSFIVEGYPNVMTAFSGLEGQALEDLVAYLKTLD